MPVTKKQEKSKSAGFLSRTRRIRKNFVVDIKTVENMETLVEYARKKLNVNKMTTTDIVVIAMSGLAKKPSLLAKWIKT